MSSCWEGSDFEFAFDLVVRDEAGCSFLEPEEADFDLSSVELLFDLFDLKLRRSVGIFSVSPKGEQLKQTIARGYGDVWRQ